jgi:alkylation response protein AidB-like acyl-CoA dehydrogenase
MPGKKFQTQAINDEILEKFNLKNRYAFLNNNLMSVLSPKEFNFLKEVQRFCMRFEKKNEITHGPEEDIYDWVKDFGEQGYITRQHNFEVCDVHYEDWGLAPDFMRNIAIDMFDPQFAMGGGATVLAINPVYEHHEHVPARLEVLKKYVTGETPGAILITEPERGSDAVHQLTTCIAQEDGSYLLNGVKIYNTNAPRAGFVVAYATAEQNNGNMMAQFLVNTSWEGFHVERVNIPWVPKLYLGKETFTDLRIPKEYILGPVGTGRDHLFEGLVPERISIAIMGVSECWGALALAIIYANNRKQFDQEILKFQGVGFLLSDLWAQTTNLTLGLLKFCEAYDEKFEKFGGEIPKNVSQAMVASASQLKYQAAKLSKKVCYECANVMGGAGLCDNTLMHDYLNISRIQEIVGGSRQIQQYIMSLSLRTLYKMSVG